MSVLPEFRWIVARTHPSKLPIAALVELGSGDVGQRSRAFAGGLSKFGCTLTRDVRELGGAFTGRFGYLGSVFTR